MDRESDSANMNPARRRELLRISAFLVSGNPHFAHRSLPTLKIALLQLGPWGRLNGDGMPSGILSDFTTLLEQESGIGLQQQIVPFSRGILMMERGNVDLMVAARNILLEEFAVPVAIIGMQKIIIVSRLDAPVRRMAELRGKIVGQIRCAHYAETIMRDPAIRKHQVDNYEQAIQMLPRRRLDAIIAVSNTFYSALCKLKLTPDRLSMPVVIKNSEALIYMSKKSASLPLLPMLTVATNTLINRGTLKRLIGEYSRNNASV